MVHEENSVVNLFVFPFVIRGECGCENPVFSFQYGRAGGGQSRGIGREEASNLCLHRSGDIVRPLHSYQFGSI